MKSRLDIQDLSSEENRSRLGLRQIGLSGLESIVPERVASYLRNQLNRRKSAAPCQVASYRPSLPNPGKSAGLPGPRIPRSKLKPPGLLKARPSSQCSPVGKNTGRGLRIFLVFLISQFIGCFSTPGWIHRLPSAQDLYEAHCPELNCPNVSLSDFAGNGELQPLAGDFERPVSTRYSVADLHSLSSGTHMIRIVGDGKNQTYYKIHTYEEWVRGRALRSIYGERGVVERKGPWVLLRPRFVYSRQQGPLKMDSEESLRRCIEPLSIEMAIKRLDTRKKIVERDPLLYFFNQSDRSLSPMAYEEDGKIYRYGFYEQLMRPYDQGAMFAETHEDFTLQIQNPHSYFSQGSEFLKNYSRDPAMDVQKEPEHNLRTDCIQDLRPTQSSK